MATRSQKTRKMGERTQHLLHQVKAHIARLVKRKGMKPLSESKLKHRLHGYLNLSDHNELSDSPPDRAQRVFNELLMEIGNYNRAIETANMSRAISLAFPTIT